MSVAAQGGIVSFGLQAAKVGKDGTFNASGISYYKMRAPRVMLGPIQDQQVFPLETGGPLVPSGSYKQMRMFGGQVDLIPRLENSFGLILKALMGTASSVTNKDADGTSVTGANTHIFRFDPTNNATLPWCSVRSMIPGATSGENFGQTGFDCRVGSVQFTIPAMGKVAARVNMIGRDFKLDDASTWTYANATMEDSTSTADAGRGQFSIGGTEYPIMGAAIEIANGLTSPQQEVVVGDFAPDSFDVLTRSATIRIVYKYQNSELFRKLLTGTANGTEWSSLPFMNTTSGATYAFDARFQAPANIGATSQPYELRVRANRVTWAVDGPPELQAGNIITQSFVGTILEPASGDYLQITVTNGQSSY